MLSLNAIPQNHTGDGDGDGDIESKTMACARLLQSPCDQHAPDRPFSPIDPALVLIP